MHWTDRVKGGKSRRAASSRTQVEMERRKQRKMHWVIDKETNATATGNDDEQGPSITIATTTSGNDDNGGSRKGFYERKSKKCPTNLQGPHHHRRHSHVARSGRSRFKPPYDYAYKSSS